MTSECLSVGLSVHPTQKRKKAKKKESKKERKRERERERHLFKRVFFPQSICLSSSPSFGLFVGPSISKYLSADLHFHLFYVCLWQPESFIFHLGSLFAIPTIATKSVLIWLLNRTVVTLISCLSLVACTQPYKSLCLSVGWSVGWSVGRSVPLCFFAFFRQFKGREAHTWVFSEL